ncbi:MAG: T9SS type A sorting domain-containing protein [Flavobacteriaceae bacterium]|nr:T9SS type A sorting domain-containing protein [Flavobacteriaceae bacterium]
MNSEAKFTIAPNPNQGELSIDLDQVYDSINISIYNSLGQRVQQKNFDKTSYIHLKLNIPTGVYFMQITTDQGNKKTLRMIRN